VKDDSDMNDALISVKTDTLSGSVELTLRSIGLLVEAVPPFEKLERTARARLVDITIQLRQSQPEMAGLRRAMRVAEDLVRNSASSRELLEGLESLRNDCVCREQQTSRNLGRTLRDIETAMTISNSRTVLEAICFAHSWGSLSKVVVLESRPAFEGRFLAQKLAQENLTVLLIADTAADVAMRREHVETVVCGADAFFSDFAVLNKIGTKMLALLSRYNQIPFKVGASTTKRLETPSTCWEETIRVHPKEELVPSDMDRRISSLNAYLELTPGELIDEIVTEEDSSSRSG